MPLIGRGGVVVSELAFHGSRPKFKVRHIPCAGSILVPEQPFQQGKSWERYSTLTVSASISHQNIIERARSAREVSPLYMDEVSCVTLCLSDLSGSVR